jgi:hypothetical protein
VRDGAGCSSGPARRPERTRQSWPSRGPTQALRRRAGLDTRGAGRHCVARFLFARHDEIVASKSAACVGYTTAGGRDICVSASATARLDCWAVHPTQGVATGNNCG